MSTLQLPGRPLQNGSHPAPQPAGFFFGKRMIATHHPSLLHCERKGIPTLIVVNSQGTDFNKNLTHGSRGKLDGATLAR
jgi:hypothetical protein